MKKLIAGCTLLLLAFAGNGQHDHHNMQQHVAPDTSRTKPADTIHSHQGHTMSMPPMSHAYSLNLPMRRNGSGTAWMPDTTPMFGYMIHSRKWMYMLHGNIFLRYNRQDIFKAGSRGDAKADAVNWAMFMGQRKVGEKGLFHFSAMLSLDALFGGNGYPLLFQTGESWQRSPLVDRQHPHDLVSELSVSYAHSFNAKTDVFVYAGYPGEPALGSVAFMHRLSSLYGPDAPLTHHWNDGTHITFGVATLGVRYGEFKVEGSVFTGSEPDENRYNFEKPRFDSYSGRLSFNPDAYWSFQVSQGFVKEPEELHPNEDVNRTTASAVYSTPLGRNRFLSATGLWGLNRTGHSNEHAALLEAALVLNKVGVYSRFEWVQKSAEELDLDETDHAHDALFPVGSLTLGAGYDLVQNKSVSMALGAQVSVARADRHLEHLYGVMPVSGEVFLRFYPPRMSGR